MRAYKAGAREGVVNVIAARASALADGRPDMGQAAPDPPLSHEELGGGLRPSQALPEPVDERPARAATLPIPARV